MMDDLRQFFVESRVLADSANEQVLFQFKQIMTSLQSAWQRSHNPKAFCSIFKNVDGSAVNISEQMDADEFFNNLMDRMEVELKDSGQAQAINRAFGGKMTQEIISKDCEHRSSTTTDFLTLSIDVKNFSSIQQSLAETVSGEVLEGENMYSCDNCIKKVRALKRESITHLPN